MFHKGDHVFHTTGENVGDVVGVVQEFSHIGLLGPAYLVKWRHSFTEPDAIGQYYEHQLMHVDRTQDSIARLRQELLLADHVAEVTASLAKIAEELSTSD